MYGEKKTSPTQTQKHQKLEGNDLMRICHMKIPRNCHDIFYGTHNGIFRQCFCEQSKNWHGEV
jgi:hypothetical protein